jgi:hypothetical protein
MKTTEAADEDNGDGGANGINTEKRRNGDERSGSCLAKFLSDEL